MAIDPGAVGATSEVVEARWTSKDCLLYALGVGAGGDDPLDPLELQFTTENSIGVEQKVLPSFALVVALGDSPLRSCGDFDWAMLVNAQQSLTVHAPLPVDGHIRGQLRIAALYDKGSGTLAVVEGTATDAATRQPMWTARTGIFIRGEGGWGGDRGPSGVSSLPDRAPDHVVTYATRVDQALLYRLSGDRTPLHSDPSFARKAGFPRPILHGRCTFGFTERALVRCLCDGDPARLRSIEGRFSKPVLPGDTLTVSAWQTGDDEALFRTATGDGTTVLDAGRCTFGS